MIFDIDFDLILVILYFFAFVLSCFGWLCLAVYFLVVLSCRVVSVIVFCLVVVKGVGEVWNDWVFCFGFAVLSMVR